MLHNFHVTERALSLLCRAVPFLTKPKEIEMGFFQRSVKLSAGVALAFAALGVTSMAQAQERFQVSADGQEVTDTQAKLTWRRCAEGLAFDGTTCKGKATKFSFVAAKKHTAATQGWRVPAKEELTTLIDKGQKKKPLIDAKAFPGTPAKLFWAVRPEDKDNLNAWIVDFGNGKVYGNTGSKAPLLRLVRSAN
jgi:hypothetical protein